MIDLRFPTALQAVLMLAAAEADGVRATSRTLAEGLGVNASFVRRLIVPLSRAGILTTSLGQKGGIGLRRPADTITLRDVYQAVIEDKKIWEARIGVPGRCFVSTNITGYFERIATEAQDSVFEMLGRRTIADSLHEMRRLAE